MPKIQPKLPVCKRDLENLRASGLTDETIRENGLRSEVDSDKLAEILKCAPTSPRCIGGLVIQYRNLQGEVNCYARVRPHASNGQKYDQAKGSPPRAYFPTTALCKLRDGKTPIHITEGEKKALALSQLDLPAVGIAGVYNWKKKGSDELIDDLAAIPWDRECLRSCSKSPQAARFDW